MGNNKNSVTSSQTDKFILSAGFEFSFPVIFTHNVFAPENMILAEIMEKGARVGVIIDSQLVDKNPNLSSQVGGYFATQGANIQGVSLMPGGEKAKHGFVVMQEILRLLSEWNICRHSYVVVVGGGALLDAAGLACALAHRGVRIIRLPSTALSQGDSGVGVKNGINLFGQKNFAGTFHPPYAVINDLDFLQTLPSEMLYDGVAEAIKVSLIKDADFFNYIQQNTAAVQECDLGVINKIIIRSAKLHAVHIAEGGDPFEFGGARPLDFGHWAAHKLETLSKHRLRHGAAVAIGVALDSVYAKCCDMISNEQLRQILETIINCGLKVFDPLLLQRDFFGELFIVGGIDEFREHLGGKLAITLPVGIGNKIEVDRMDISLVTECVEYLREVEQEGLD